MSWICYRMATHSVDIFIALFLFFILSNRTEHTKRNIVTIKYSHELLNSSQRQFLCLIQLLLSIFILFHFLLTQIKIKIVQRFVSLCFIFRRRQKHKHTHFRWNARCNKLKLVKCIDYFCRLDKLSTELWISTNIIGEQTHKNGRLCGERVNNNKLLYL